MNISDLRNIIQEEVDLLQKDSKEYEELLECVSSPPIEQKKKAFAGKI